MHKKLQSMMGLDNGDFKETLLFYLMMIAAVVAFLLGSAIAINKNFANHDTSTTDDTISVYEIETQATTSDNEDFSYQ